MSVTGGPGPRRAKVWFVGAGPGAADLVTLRGARALAEADLVVWAASLVHPDMLGHARQDAEVVDSAPLTLEDMEVLFRRAVREDLVVARVHTGDPSLYGAVQEQRAVCDRLGLAHETVPGVSAFSAVAARVSRELTIPEVAQSLVVTRLEGGRTPVPPGETVRAFAAHGTTMALYLSVARAGRLQAELLAGGYPPDTPCVVARAVSWPEELVLRCRLADLESTVLAHGLRKHTLVLVGPALGASGTRSHLYHPACPHEYRPGAVTGSVEAPGGDGSVEAPGGDGSVSPGSLSDSPDPGPDGDVRDPDRPGTRPPGDAPGRDGTRGPGAAARPALTVVGLDGGDLPGPVREALAGAQLVVGGDAQLDVVAADLPEGVRRVPLTPLREALRLLAERTGPAVVLASGDPGWFGIVRALSEAGEEPRVLPAPSCLARLAGALGRPWDDVVTVSAHGRDPRPALNAARALPAVAVLTGPGCTVADVARAVRGWPRELAVGERLGTPDERVLRCDPATAAARRWSEPAVVLVTRTGAPRSASARWHDQPACPPDGWSLPEDVFAHRDAMVTKAEVRALVLARLAPRVGRMVWDVGAGSGSVAVECARFGAAAVAVERDGTSCGRVARNARAHGVDVRVVHGNAPEALSGLPAPDAAFIGGGGPDVVEAVAARGVPRVVVACAALDHALAARAALRRHGYRVEGAQLSASRIAELPDGAVRLEARNPVLVLWADGPDHDVPGTDGPGGRP